jgi:hypothetical protein
MPGDAGQVERADLELGQHLVGGGLVQRHLHLRVVGHEAAQRVGQERIRGQADEADRQGTRLPLRRIVRAALEQLGTCEHGSRIVQRLLAFARDRDAARAALEQRHAQLGLELLDRQAHRWLRQVQARGRAAEMQLFGDGHQAAEMTHFHRSVFWINR